MKSNMKLPGIKLKAIVTDVVTKITTQKLINKIKKKEKLKVVFFVS